MLLSFSSRFRAGLALALAAGLALTAGACMAPPAKKSAAGGAGERAAKAGPAEAGAEAGTEGGKAKGKQTSWWRRMTRAPERKPWVYGDVRPGKGLLGDDEHGFTLLRRGEGGSSDPTKPSKVRR